jgi:hypothetical protein
LNTGTGEVRYSANTDQDIAAITYYDLSIRGAGTKTLLGNLDVNNTFELLASGSLIVDADAVNNYNINVANNWESNGNIFEPRNGQVIFDGAGNHIIEGNFTGNMQRFHDITVNNDNLKLRRGNILVGGTLNTNNTNVDADYANVIDTLIVGVSTTQRGTLNSGSGYVVGALGKWFTTGAQSYKFLNGTNTLLRPVNIDFNNVTSGGYVVVDFDENDPGENGLPLSEGGYDINSTFTEGFWRITGHSGFDIGGNTFNLEAEAENFNSFELDSAARIVSRSSTSDAFTLNGTHVEATGDTVKRNTMDLFPLQIAVAKALGFPDKPVIPVGPVDLCQDPADTDYETDSTARAESYEWEIIDVVTTSGVNPPGTFVDGDSIITINFDPGFYGTFGLRVRGVNAAGEGPWSDTLTVTVHENPVANAGADMNTCYPNAVTLNGSASGGAGGYGYEWAPADSLDNELLEDPTYTPSSNPNAVSVTVTFTLTVTDSQGCWDTNQMDVILYRRPETGNQYYVPNEFDQN